MVSLYCGREKERVGLEFRHLCLRHLFEKAEARLAAVSAKIIYLEVLERSGFLIKIL